MNSSCDNTHFEQDGKQLRMDNVLALACLYSLAGVPVHASDHRLEGQQDVLAQVFLKVLGCLAPIPTVTLMTFKQMDDIT